MKEQLTKPSKEMKEKDIVINGKSTARFQKKNKIKQTLNNGH